MVQKHYYYFGDELQKKMNGKALTQENWEVLRNDEVEGPFSIEKTVEAYEENCKKSSSYEEVASIIIQELEKRGNNNKIVSLGIGKGILEWHLKKQKPTLSVECTDYTAEAIEKLKKVFISMDDGYPFDMLKGHWNLLGTDSILLMFRVSTEFNQEQWQNIFEKMYIAGIRNIIYIPTELCTIKEMIMERINHLRCIVRGRKAMFCGWLYSEKEFEKIFRGNRNIPLYDIESRIPFENTAVYFLRRHK